MLKACKYISSRVRSPGFKLLTTSSYNIDSRYMPVSVLKPVQVLKKSSGMNHEHTLVMSCMKSRWGKNTSCGSLSSYLKSPQK